MNYKTTSWMIALSMVLMVFAFHNESEKSEIQLRNINGAGREPGRYQELGKVSQVQKEIKNEQSVVFNDPAIISKWDLEKTDAVKAWQVSQGSRHIVVAIIDTGCDVKHEDLLANIWTNPGESGLDKNKKDKSINGIDDDENGFIDDIHGWNFVANNGDLTDRHGHGTHIAGIIGAEGGNNKGIIGIAPKVSLLCLKYYEPKTPTDNLKNTIAAIKYVKKMNDLWERRKQNMRIHIVNYSGGGLEFSEDEKQAIQSVQKQGVLFVAAAGNEKSNSDRLKYYPADYGLQNIISVTAIDPNTEVLPSSNYGTETVDIAAPGQAILSTLPTNNYGLMTGTSQATAFVSGAAAVVMAHKGTFAADDVKKYLISTGDSQVSLLNKTGTSRKLNLYKALTVLDQGMGITGVKAMNITTPQAFNPENELFKGDSINGNKRDPTSQVSQFGKSLMDSVQKTHQTDFSSKKDPN